MRKELDKLINNETENRKNILEDLCLFMKNNGRFSVLVKGERGTGKTKWVKTISVLLKKEKIKWCNNLTTVSCASFGENDLNAEAELFGYEPGAYTGSNPKGKDGLFIKADKGILFLDEVHHLSPRVQAKLLTALQTESEKENRGKYGIKKIHSSKLKYVEVRIIFGTNLSNIELKKKISPDLYDRISQLTIELPSLEKDEGTLRKYFEQIFINMDQKSNSSTIPIPKINTLYKWLSTTNLEGNFRDIEKIVILWGQFYIKFNGDEEKIFISVKQYFEKSNPKTVDSIKNITFSLADTYEYYLKQFQKEYAVFIKATEIYKNSKQGDKLEPIGRTKKVIESWLKY